MTTALLVGRSGRFFIAISALEHIIFGVSIRPWITTTFRARTRSGAVQLATPVSHLEYALSRVDVYNTPDEQTYLKRKRNTRFSVLSPLVDLVERTAPIEYSLPEEIRSFFKGGKISYKLMSSDVGDGFACAVHTGPRGQYTDVAMRIPRVKYVYVY